MICCKTLEISRWWTLWRCIDIIILYSLFLLFTCKLNPIVFITIWNTISHLWCWWILFAALWFCWTNSLLNLYHKWHEHLSQVKIVSIDEPSDSFLEWGIVCIEYSQIFLLPFDIYVYDHQWFSRVIWCVFSKWLISYHYGLTFVSVLLHLAIAYQIWVGGMIEVRVMWLDVLLSRIMSLWTSFAFVLMRH